MDAAVRLGHLSGNRAHPRAVAYVSDVRRHGGLTVGFRKVELEV
jgi:hypothetical protein